MPVATGDLAVNGIVVRLGKLLYVHITVLDKGLIIGSWQHVIYFLALDEDDEGVYVEKSGRASIMLEPNGFVPLLNATPGQRLVIGVFGIRPDEHALLLLGEKGSMPCSEPQILGTWPAI